MVEYKIIFSKLADKDKKLLKQAGLENKAKELLELISLNPYQTPPTVSNSRTRFNRNNKKQLVKKLFLYFMNLLLH